MFRGMTDQQLDRIKSMLNVTITDNNASVLFFRAQLVIWAAEILDEVERRESTARANKATEAAQQRYLRDDKHAADKLAEPKGPAT